MTCKFLRISTLGVRLGDLADPKVARIFPTTGLRELGHVVANVGGRFPMVAGSRSMPAVPVPTVFTMGEEVRMSLESR